jgi:cytochrome c oxidase cbb3-type subunit 1
MNATVQTHTAYNDEIVKSFTVAAIFWGLAGFTVGLLIALQLAFPELNCCEYLTFGRLRPLHTSAVIFAFGGNVLIGTSFFVVQRTCQTVLWGENLSKFVFWGYQVFILMAGLGYLAGVTQNMRSQSGMRIYGLRLYGFAIC